MEAIYYDNLHWVYINSEKWTASAMSDGDLIEYPHESDALAAHPGVPVVWEDVTDMTPERFGCAVSTAITAKIRQRKASNAALAVFCGIV